MGPEVPFRTLRLNGGENEQHLRILRVEDSAGREIKLELEGDTLRGRPTSGGGAASPKNIKGATLFLSTRDESPAYKLTITDVTSEPFWAECDKGACPGPPSPSKQYHFSAIRMSDSCAVQVCDPSLSDHPGGGIAGVAAIFRDDYYDDTTYSVSGTPPIDPTQNDNDLFNIACRGTDIYKLYMLRHTRASAASTETRTTVPQRTTMLRALSATYCGRPPDGRPETHFTVDGRPIELKLNPARSPYVLTRASGYRFDKGTVDALWSHEGDVPAMCIGTPRMAPLAEVLDTCELPRCGDPSAADYYLLTATPPGVTAPAR